MKKMYFLFIFLFLLGTIFSLYRLVFVRGEYYEKVYQDKTNVYVESLSTPRGRILDIHGKVLVDNVGVKTIVYRKLNVISVEEEMEVATLLAELLSLKESASLLELKKFWMVKYPMEAKKLITEEEYRLYEERKLNSQDLYLLKLDRITEEVLSVFSEQDKKIAYVYTLMNRGYYYDAKVIKKDVTESEYASVLEEKIMGVTNEMFFAREYPYGSTLKSLFGSVGSIPKEEESMYLNQGYASNDIVGI